MDEVALLYTLYSVCAIAETIRVRYRDDGAAKQSKFSDARMTRSRRHSDAGEMGFGWIPTSSGQWHVWCPQSP
jgi:hypothetical protein